MNLGNETRVTLSNGITVVNFSSRRRLEFEDGSVLEGVSEIRARRLLCKPDEQECSGPAGVTAVVLKYHVTDHLVNELRRLIDDPTVDIILVPMPIISALSVLSGVFDKVCRIVTEESGRISIEKFYKYK